MMNPEDKKSVLVLIRGLPGSGKSRIAYALQDELGTEKTVVLDPDAIDYESVEYQEYSEQLTRDGVDKILHAYRFLRSRAYSAIENGQIVVWNQAFTNLDILQKTAANLQAYAQERNMQLPFLLVEVEIDPEAAKQRVASRAKEGGHDVPDEHFARFARDYRSFATEGFDMIAVQGEDAVLVSVSKITTALDDL